jgi:hypothetical protein
LSGNVFVQPEGLQTFSQTHSGIAGALPQSSAEATPGPVETSHGPIAAAANAALRNALSSRGGTVQATTTSAATISELLHRAARAYQEGDLRSAEELRAAANAIADGTGAGGAGPAGAPGAGVSGVPGAGVSGPGAAGGADTMGQMLGQIGGQVGQLAGMAMAPLQGLAQVPQQVMQGIQQAVQTATGAAGMAAGADAAGLEEAALDGERATGAPEHAERPEGQREQAAGAQRDAPPVSPLPGAQAGPDSGPENTAAPDPAGPTRAQIRPPVH